MADPTFRLERFIDGHDESSTFPIGYRLNIYNHDHGRWPGKYTISGQVYGISNRRKTFFDTGNYDAEDVLRQSEYVTVIDYWSWHDGQRVETEYADPNREIKLDSESGNFFAYCETMTAIDGIKKTFDKWLHENIFRLKFGLGYIR